MNRFFITVLLCLLLAAPAVVAQQGEEEPMGHMGGPPPREKMEQLRKMKLLETLNLDEETSARFIVRYNKHQEEMRQAFEERGTASDLLDKAIEESRDKDLPKLIENVLAIDRKISTEREQFIVGLRDILTVRQQAKLIAFDRNFNKEVREMILNMRRGRRGNN